MSYLPYIIAALAGLLLGLILGASIPGLIGFIALGLVASSLSQMLKPGSESVYWISVSLIVFMIGLSYFGVNIDGFIFVAPMIFALTYFAARLARRFTGTQV